MSIITSPKCLADAGAVELARRISDGVATSAEIVDAAIARIERSASQLNALTTPCFTAAREAAIAADQMTSEQRRSRPLHGVPITVKDCFGVNGLPTTLGNTSATSLVARRDAEAVRLLRDAGAIIIGKTSVPQLMALYECDSPRFGRTVNPWNAARTCGGSSGGGAAIVADGSVSLDLGTDAAGSTRLPAHFCGVHTLITTPRSIPSAGMVDGIPGMAHVTPVVAPIARYVEDLIVATNVLATCPSGRTEWLRLPDANSLSRLRIAMWTEHEAYPVSPAIQRGVREAAQVLGERGVEIVELAPPPLGQLLQLFVSLWMADGSATLRHGLRGSKIDPRLRRMLWSGRLPGFLRAMYVTYLRSMGDEALADVMWACRPRSVAGYWHLIHQVQLLREDFLRRWSEARIDAILCPPYALPAFQHGHSIELMPAACYMVWTSLFGLPAGVISSTHVLADEEVHPRRSETGAGNRRALATERGSVGLPVAVQIVARPCCESVVAALMLGIEAELTKRSRYTPPRQHALGRINSARVDD